MLGPIRRLLAAAFDRLDTPTLNLVSWIGIVDGLPAVIATPPARLYGLAVLGVFACFLAIERGSVERQKSPE
ncbi:hypothetical protein EBR56_09065 [bacterium]|nr:hypothetical protein [bacterium]